MLRPRNPLLELFPVSVFDKIIRSCP